MALWRITVLALCLVGISAPTAAQQVSLTFDDLGELGSPAEQVGERYAAQGAHFALDDFGVIEGLVYGDSGNWGLDGTRGPWFQGFNGIPGFTMTVTFDRPIEGFALDVSRANGSDPANTFTLIGFRGTEQVEEITVPLPSINTWATVALASTGIDRVEWVSNGVTEAYGIDHVRYSFVPEVDSYRCYKAKDRKTPAAFAPAEVQAIGALEDKIHQVRKPIGYCEPVDVEGEGIENPDDLLVCYQIKDAKTDPKQPKFAKQDAATTDAFGSLGLQLKKATTLCVRAGETP